MRTKTIALAAGGALALTTLGGAAVAVPVLAGSAATSAAEPTADATAAERLAERTARIAERLAGMVEDSTVTQEQADAVAGTLAKSGMGGGPGGHGGRGGGFGRLLHQGLAPAATALGLEEDVLRDRLRSGQTLGEVADAEGVGRADLVAALVAAAEEALAGRVAAGDLTQKRADEIAANLTEKVTASLDRDGPLGRGGGPHARPGSTEGETDS